MAYTIKHRIFTIFAILLMIGIAYSRLYLGVHYLGDVAGGIIIGTMLFLCAIVCIPYYDKIWNIRLISSILIFVLIPLIVSIALKGNEIAKSLGVLSGFSIGFILNKDKTEEIAFKLVPSMIKFIIGITIILIFKEGLKIIFPSYAIFDFIRYWMMGIWVSYGAPAIFARIPYLTKNSLQN